MDLKKIYEGLKADFPKEAYSKDSSRGFDLTSLKAQYIIERLNDVVGITGWKLSGEFQPTDKGVLYMGTLSLVNDSGELVHSVEAIGYADNKKNTGDTYKSARTDALSKAASYYGLGNEMFKGNISVGGASKVPSKPSKPTKPSTSKPTSGFGGSAKPSTDTSASKPEAQVSKPTPARSGSFGG